MELCSRVREKLEEEEMPMAGMIQWETDLKKALERADSEKKTVLLFFHNPA